MTNITQFFPLILSKSSPDPNNEAVYSPDPIQNQHNSL